MFVADIDAIHKILINLMSNAIKFTEAGQIDLTLSLEANNLRITVKDTGIGVPAHLQEIIFETFRQADASPSRIRGGSGFGVSHCSKPNTRHAGPDLPKKCTWQGQ